MKTFGGIDIEYSTFKNASVLLQSIPYDGTSTWGKGADKGFQAFLEAAENMELYDIEADMEVYRNGIHILDPITENKTPESMCDSVYQTTNRYLKSGKYLTAFGGEHSVSIGIIKAFYERYQDLTVLHLDAHADLRQSYEGSSCNHACALHDASQHANLIQLGIRSMDISEKEYLNPEQCYFAHEMHDSSDWQGKSISQMTDDVYLTIDLDYFDPSIMPATGTPEPGGLDWHITLSYLKQVFELKNVVGFDIVELAPIPGYRAPNFLAAKLYYKLLSYRQKYHG